MSPSSSSPQTSSLKNFYEDTIFRHLKDRMGIAGLVAIKNFSKAIHEVYRYCEPGQFSNFYIRMSLSNNEEMPRENLETIPADLLPSRFGDNVIVHVLGSGRYYIEEFTDAPTVGERRHSALTYHYNQKDIIWVEDDCFPLTEENDHSIYCGPTFSHLIQSLDHYASAHASMSTCQILQKIWHDPTQRSILTSKPESHMRDSLEHHLRSALMHAVVTPEQNCDESHPVDLVVRWSSSNREALIEIKWIGKNSSSTTYTDGRARDGYAQVSNYVVERRNRQPSTVIRGFLVVFDARRGPVYDPLKYRNKNIDYRDLLNPGKLDIHTCRIFLLPTQSS